IAAHVEAIPLRARVVGQLSLYLAGYVGGAFLKLSGRPAAGEGAWIVAAAGFGASIALIAQIYHMSGDEAEAVFVWGAGTALAAAVLRSGALNAGAALLAGAWMLMKASQGWSLGGPPLSWPVVAAVLYALSFWTRSVLSRHLLLLSLYLFTVLAYWRDETTF